MTIVIRPAEGPYQSKTRVRIGSLFLDESTPGFRQTPEYTQFIAQDQPLALHGASTVSPSGLETVIKYSWKDAREERSAEEVKLVPVGANLVEVTVPKGKLTCATKDKDSIETFPVVVTIGDKAFGLGDAPFKSETAKYITFIVSKDFIKALQTLTVKRLLLGREFMYSYRIPELYDAIDISVLSTNKEDTLFALVGAGLDKTTRVVYPPDIQLSVKDNDHGTVAFLTLSAKKLTGLKQLVLQRGSDPPMLVPLPDAKAPEKKTTLSAQGPVGVGKGVPYTISGPTASSIKTVQYSGKDVPFTPSPDKKSISLTLPDDMTASPGTRLLDITYSDKSTEQYKVEVSNSKAK